MPRMTLTATLAGALLAISPVLLAQDNDIPRTAHGFVDLQGIYTYRTLTPLNLSLIHI